MSASAERARQNPAAEALYHDADIAFHRVLIAAAGNRALGNMTEPVHRALAEARRPLARPEHRIDRSLPEHRRILAAVAARDVEEARAAMRDHLRTVEGYLNEYARELEERTRLAPDGAETEHGEG
jgi:GntR family transcriptional repressor for pyruvate dehydrogenase complex